ncbi:MAG: mitochondrial small ribosomal subunit protein uS9m [Chloroflexi bacterium]|nr:mitochondrial small ribosomal subunit protein uS9m [Chloroflexota bacterium]
MAWDALIRRKAKGDYYHPEIWEVFLQAGEVMDQAVVDRLDMLGLVTAEAESQGLPVGDGPSQQWVGWGRLKLAVAQAVLRPGSGELMVNGEPILEYFRKTPGKARGFLLRLLEMGEVKQLLAQMEGIVRVEGSKSGSKRQAHAVAHAVARALTGYNNQLGDLLAQRGFGGVKVKASKKF